MAYLDWKVGDKVVCVASPERIAMRLRQFPGARYPHSNAVYTIREIRDDAALGSTLCLLLAEIDNSHLVGQPGYVLEPGFSLGGFRKVQPRKTDIAIFTAMLDPSRQQVDA